MTGLRTTALLTFVLGLIGTTLAGTAAASADEGPEAPTREVVVRFEDDPDGRPQFVSAELNETQVDLLEAHPQIEGVEDVDGGAITDSDHGPQRQWEFTSTGIENLWDHATGDNATVIAVLDTGVDPAADLEGRLLPGISFTGHHAWHDRNGHGTAVALTSAAAVDNSIAGVGACPECSILPVQVARSNGSVRWDTASRGIIWAADEGADVINLSFGGFTGSRLLEDSIRYATDHGVVVIGAAGNNGLDRQFYPAAYPDVVSVGGHDENGGRYSFSNHGSWVDVAAAGCVWVSEPTPKSRCGTSFAAPIVAGVAGLLLSTDHSPSETIASLQHSARSTGWTASGNINGHQLAAMLAPPTADVPAARTGAPTPTADEPAAVDTPATTPQPEPSTPTNDAAADFDDVADTAYYADAVTWLATNGISTGTTPTTFSPDQPLTRAQAATLLWRAAGTPTTPTNDAAANFDDVADTAYYADAVTWLATNGISTGTTSTTFSPDQPLTRAQAATLLWRAAGTPTTPTNDAAANFDDVADTAYYADAVTWLATNGISTGTSPAAFSPELTLTRAQAATLLWRNAGSPAA